MVVAPKGIAEEYLSNRPQNAKAAVLLISAAAFLCGILLQLSFLFCNCSGGVLMNGFLKLSKFLGVSIGSGYRLLPAITLPKAIPPDAT